MCPSEARRRPTTASVTGKSVTDRLPLPERRVSQTRRTAGGSDSLPPDRPTARPRSVTQVPRSVPSMITSAAVAFIKGMPRRRFCRSSGIGRQQP